MKEMDDPEGLDLGRDDESVRSESMRSIQSLQSIQTERDSIHGFHERESMHAIERARDASHTGMATFCYY